MLNHKQRLAKLEGHQPLPQRTPEEINAEIHQLLAEAGTTLDAEIAKHGSVQGLMKALRAD